jgi:ketosteroid isomerase-like protein
MIKVMSQTRVLFVVLFALLAACQSPAPHGSSEQEQVLEAFGRFIAAFNSLDWESFRQSFASDATLFNPAIPEAAGPGRVDGREDVENSFRSVFAAARSQASGSPYLHIVPEHVLVQPLTDAAIVTFEFDRGDGSIGRRTLVFRRQATGWKIVHVHASNAVRR